MRNAHKKMPDETSSSGIAWMAGWWVENAPRFHQRQLALYCKEQPAEWHLAGCEARVDSRGVTAQLT